MNKLLSTYCELIGRFLATLSSDRLNLRVRARSHPLVVVSALARSSHPRVSSRGRRTSLLLSLPRLSVLRKPLVLDAVLLFVAKAPIVSVG